jgi:hypothetical protein
VPSLAERQYRAQQALAAFRAAAPPGVWPQLAGQQIADEIAQRLNDPFLVNQEPEPLCGPAVIVFELVRKQPDRYVAICQELFEYGGFSAETAWVEAPDDLLQRAVPGPMAQVDWMLMATMRDTENLIFDADPDSSFGDVYGITMPWAMKEWTRELLGCSAVECTSTAFWGEEDALIEARDTVQAGGVAFVLIDKALLKKTSPWPYYPNHWMALLDVVSIQEGGWFRDGQYHFNVYSWGGSEPVNVGEERFEDCFFGVVTGHL